jgi:hypothetical protein
VSGFAEHVHQAEDALSILDAEKEPGAWEEAIRSGEVALAVQAANAHALLAIALQLDEIRDGIARLDGAR